MDCTPDPSGVIARFENSDKYYGYPFSRMANSQKDATLSGIIPGDMLLPNGRRVAARISESYVYATDEKLKSELKLDRDEFAASHCLNSPWLCSPTTGCPSNSRWKCSPWSLP